MAKLATPVLELTWSPIMGYLFVDWQEIEGAELYSVYENGVLSEQTQYAGYNIVMPPAGEYEYKVIASGTGYEDSDPGYGRITIDYTPPEPENLEASFLDDPKRIELTWDEVWEAESYLIEKIVNRDWSRPIEISGRNNFYSDTDVEYGNNYVYFVYSVSGELKSWPPAEVEVKIPPKLNTPTGLEFRNLAETSVQIVWNGVENAGEYLIRRYDGTSASPMLFYSTKNSFKDFSIEAGKTYQYSVTATRSGFLQSSESEKLTVKNLSQLPVPGALHTTALSETSVSFSWLPVSRATSYVVHTSSGQTYMAFSTSYSVPSEPGASLEIEVRSFAANYYVSEPARLTIVNKSRIPALGISELSNTQNSVSVGWSANPNATSYVLRKDGQIVYSGTERVYVDSGLTLHATHTYSVTAIAGSGYYNSLPSTVTVRVGNEFTTVDSQQDYMEMLRHPFTKLCRIRFLNPDGTTAFALDNNPVNPKSKAFIADGVISGSWQNGQRYTASVTLNNVDGEFDFSVNHLWFGQEIAIDEGLVLSNGEEYYRQSGVFLIDNPTDNVQPNGSTVTYNLVDKWANLDGTLGGNLEGSYEVPIGTNIFEPMVALLLEDRGNGRPLDGTPPVFTEYYNGKTQLLPDGTQVLVTDSPYTLNVDGDSGTVASILLELAGMVNAWIGYDVTGALRIDPSQDDISDISKPVSWRFTQDETQLLGMTYTSKKGDVFNDYIVVGEQLDDNSQPGGRAQNLDPASDTNIMLIGRKTKRESASGYATAQQCKDLAEWRLKRSSVLQKAVSISCSQMFHIDLNSLVEIVRSDKPGSPTERHLVQGFSRPLASDGAMTISATSVNDFVEATVTPWPPET